VSGLIPGCALKVWQKIPFFCLCTCLLFQSEVRLCWRVWISSNYVIVSSGFSLTGFRRSSHCVAPNSWCMWMLCLVSVHVISRWNFRLIIVWFHENFMHRICNNFCSDASLTACKIFCALIDVQSIFWLEYTTNEQHIILTSLFWN